MTKTKQTYGLSVFNSVEKAYVADQCDCTLDELGDILTTFTQVSSKDEVPLFNLAKFKTLEEGAECARKYDFINGERQETYKLLTDKVRRCKSNLISLGGIVLDVDNNHSLEDVVLLLDGVYYIVYTTFNHTWDKHKFRVVLPFSTPLMAEDIDGRIDSIIDTFPGVDRASFSVSQSFYFHSGADKENSFARVVEGELINPYDFEVRVVEQVEAPAFDFNPMSDDMSERYRANVVESLLTCSGLHYDSQNGHRNGGVLTLVSICRSVGLSYEEFDAICQAICDPSSTLVKREIRKVAWTGWKSDKITRDKRNDFIKANGGKPPQTHTPWQETRHTLFEKYKKSAC
jgi:hypothetical protein